MEVKLQFKFQILNKQVKILNAALYMSRPISSEYRHQTNYISKDIIQNKNFNVKQPVLKLLDINNIENKENMAPNSQQHRY